MRITLSLLLLCLATDAAQAPAVNAQMQTCGFVLGFADLRTALPTIVGDCVEDEHHNPNNGDALQRTTGGLLVWRKADNWTAFTDGSATWISGPLGLQQRQDTQRFQWEPNPDRFGIVPPVQTGQRCPTAGLSVSAGRVDAGAGNYYQPFQFTNMTDVACVMRGFPGAQLRDAGGNALPTDVHWGGGYFNDDPAPRSISVAPGGQAEFTVHWEQVPVDDEPPCPVADQLGVIPPDEYSPLLVDVQIRACGHGRLDISAVHRPDGAASLPPGVVDAVQIGLVVLDHGDIGCGDDVRLVTRQVAPTRAPLRTALTELLGVDQQVDPDSHLYTALYQSHLDIESLNITSDGTAVIRLAGALQLGGVCDGPRVEAQLRRTALQFSTVHEVQVWLNGRPLMDALSLR
ncbi:MAG: DUF4232 domain-containing protein [Chloroflexota bacterium]|nr:DUF4232 domain-containing protein [Chloroflexota bacterium]